jgi:hypothetical protein
MCDQPKAVPACVDPEQHYEAPVIRNVGHAREIFLGDDSGDEDDNFRAPNRSRTCI